MKKFRDNFDVSMGAWDRVEIAKLVRPYLLHVMSLNIFDKGAFGLYRDDRLAVT